MADDFRPPRNPGRSWRWLVKSVNHIKPDQNGNVDIDTSGGSGHLSRIDLFDVTDDATAAFTLTYIPVDQSWNVTLNGVTATDGVDYTITSNVLTVTAPTALFLGAAGDTWVLQAQYDHLGATPPAPVYTDEVAADTPWLWWRGVGSAYPTMPDLSGNNRDGTWDGGLYAVHGLPTIVPTVTDGESVDGFLGPSATSSERPTYTGGDLSVFIGSDFTLEMWCKPASIPQPGEHSTGGLFDLDYGTVDGPTVEIGGFGKPTDGISFYFRGTTAQSASGVIAAATVYHVVATYKASTGAMKLYLNNVVIASETAVTGGLAGAPTFFKSGAVYNGLRHFDGPYQEVALYTSELSAARIDAHYTAGVGS